MAGVLVDGAAPADDAGLGAAPAVEVGGCGICDGQGGSAAHATGMMLPSDVATIQNGLERTMKSSIIMRRRSEADRKPHDSDMPETDARLALIHDWLSRELHLPLS